MAGLDASLFAYGSAGSGKSSTLQGRGSDPGIIDRPPVDPGIIDRWSSAHHPKKAYFSFAEALFDVNSSCEARDWTG
eukprot:1191191-Prorocentrum_minimum.AAC.3